MAKITDYSFRSNDDRQTPIHAVKWKPDNGEVTACIQIVHGMREYIERYSGFAEFLTTKQFAVFGHDHIGHGYSVERTEDRGIMHCKKPDIVMVEDIYSNYKIMRREYPDRPCFILGHSMGSYLLREFLAEKAEFLSDLSGSVIMGTGCENNAALFFGNILCRQMMLFKGRNGHTMLLPALMFSGSYKKFDRTGKHPENSWLSKNVDNVKKYFDPSDPRNHCVFSVNGYNILLRSTWYDNRKKNIRKMNMDIPVIFVSGDQDPVGAMGEGVRKSYSMFKEAGVKDVSIKLYEGDRHEILNELDRDRVYEDLYEWMKERMQ